LSASTAQSAEPPAQQPEVKSFVPIIAKRLDGTSSANTSHGAITAPAGRVIDHLLEAELTEKGKSDVLAWVRSPDGTTGELVGYTATREGGPLIAKILAQLPSSFAGSPNCKVSSDLRQIGHRTVAISVRQACADSPDTASNEWIAAVSPARNPAVAYQLTMVGGPYDGLFEAVVDAVDRDGDGLDDLQIRFRIKPSSKVYEEAATENINASVRYFNRPAGFSKDPSEPASSFATMAQRAEKMAKGKDRDAVRPLARAVRQLYQGLCMEGGQPRVSVMGGKLECGAKASILRVTAAEIEAAIGAKDIFGAVGAFERLLTQGAGPKEIDAARSMIDKAVPPRDVQAYQLPFHPSMNPNGTSKSPLAFDSEGTLLIRTDMSAMRFDPKQRIALEDPESGPLPPWAVRVESTDSRVAFDGIETTSNGRAFLAKLIEGGNTIRVPLPIDPTPQPIAVTPVGWNASGIHILTSLGPIFVATDGTKSAQRPPWAVPWTPGAPLSANGNHLVVASSIGVVVVTGETAAAWRTSAITSGYEKLQGCVIANDQAAVACLDGKMTRVFLPN